MSKFTNAIEHNWPDYTIAPGATTSCDSCFQGLSQEEKDNLSDQEQQTWDEGGFSWSECDSCSSTLGGNRFSAHALHHEAFGPNAKQPNNIHHIEICVDCLMFHANGEEPEIWE